MKPKLTTHASQRIAERCSIHPDVLIGMIIDGATAVIEMLSAAKYAHHLFYSPEDMEWFVAIIKNSRQILTVMPADWEQDRVLITNAQKRSVRKRALEWERKGAKSSKMHVDHSIQSISTPLVTGTTHVAKPIESIGLPGWKVIISYTLNGCHLAKNLVRTTEDHGSPDDWSKPGEVHDWVKQRLVETEIPVRAIRGIQLEKKSGSPLDGWTLLEYLPMTQEEIAACA
jgi:hypothetical protein